MKRVLNINTFLILVVLFILINILGTQYEKITNYFHETNLYKQLIIVKFDSNYALVKNEKVLIDSDASVKPYARGNTIMIPLNFFIKCLTEKYIYNENNGFITISYNNKKLQIKENLNIHITVNKSNRVFEYNCESGEYANSTIYLPLPVLAEFFDKIVYKKGNITIISNSNNLGEIDLDKINTILEVKKPAPIKIPEVKVDEMKTDENLGAYNWIKNNRLVAHALGGINGQDYTNSYEAFIYNYNNGYRIFETDLIMTRDGHLVARHDWYLNNLIKFERKIPYSLGFLKSLRLQDTDDGRKIEGYPSIDEFKSILVRGIYKPLDFIDIVHLLEEYPDIYIVTDTKGMSKEEVERTFKYIVNQADKIDSEVLNRIIPQIYNEDMLGYIKNVHKFPSYIYTLYQLEDRNEDEIIKFAKENNIKVIVMPKESYSDTFMEKLKAEDIYVYVHTVNDLKEVSFYSNNGIYGFYTDFIIPENIKN